MSRVAAGLVVLGVLLPAELLLLTLRFDGAALAGATDWRARVLVGAHYLPQLLIVAVGAALAIDASRIGSLLERVRGAAPNHRRRPAYLLGHLVAFGALYWLSRAVFDEGGSSVGLTAAWMGAACATLILWLGALAPPSLWRAELSRSKHIVALATVVGAAAWWAGLLAEGLWEVLAGATFRVSSELLSLLYSGVQSVAQTRTIRVEGFGVQIAPECSGLEGMGLFVVFMAAYLWFFRDRHRVLRSLLLLPIGVLALWVLNAARIAALVVVGVEISPTIAVQGFHSQAGWIIFTAVALAMVFTAGRIPFFLRDSARVDDATPSPTPSYLIPVLALLAATMFTGLLADQVDWYYPLRIAAAATALVWFRRSYRRFFGAPSWEAIGAGAVVFAGWVALEAFAPQQGAALLGGLRDMPVAKALSWLAVRVVGSVVVIPIVEELAFRAYLIRRLARADFESVPFTSLPLLPVLASSIAFGLMHDRWVAGTLAGLAYAWILQRRGQLADPVAAHMTTNALIAAAVLLAGQWGLWA